MMQLVQAWSTMLLARIDAMGSLNKTAGRNEAVACARTTPGLQARPISC
jgi:hypothetical protein